MQRHYRRNTSVARLLFLLLRLVGFVLSISASCPFFHAEARLTSSAAVEAEGHLLYKAYVPNGIDPRMYYFAGNEKEETEWATDRVRERLLIHSGRHTHIILFDSGIDRSFFDYHNRNPSNHPDAGGHGVQIECVSVVPGVSCFDVGHTHGTYSASVIISNLTQLKNTIFMGIAPRAQLTIIRIFDTHMATQPQYIQKGLQYVYERLLALPDQSSHKNIILSFSYGSELIYRYFTATTSNASSSSSSPSNSIADYMNRLRHIHRARPHLRLLLISSAGNEGPRLGTITEPSDHVDWLTVGALQLLPPSSSREGNSTMWFRSTPRRTASFSSRGPVGYTSPSHPHAPHFITKPNLLALGQHVKVVRRLLPFFAYTNFSSSSSSCNSSSSGTGYQGVVTRSTSGTSIATPIVAAVAALVMESLEEKYREARCEEQITSSSSSSVIEKKSSFCVLIHQIGFVHIVKSLLLRSARLLTPPIASPPSASNMYKRYLDIISYSYNAQGAGEVQPLAALAALEKLYKNSEHSNYPTVYTFPPLLYNKVPSQRPRALHASAGHDKACVLSFPYCTQPLYFSATPLQYVLTLYVNSGAHDAKKSSQSQQLAPVKVRVQEVEEVNKDGAVFLQTDVEHSEAASFLCVHAQPLSSPTDGPQQTPLLLLLDVTIYATEEAQRYLDAHPLLERMHLNGTLRVNLHPRGNVSFPSAALFAEVPFVLTLVAAPQKRERAFLDLEHYWHATSFISLQPRNHTNITAQKEAVWKTVLFIPGSDPHEGQLQDREPNPSHMNRRIKRVAAAHHDRDVIQQPFSHVQNNLLLFYLYLRCQLELYVELFPISAAVEHSNNKNENDHKVLRSYMYRHVQYYLLFSPQKPLLKAKRLFLKQLVRPSVISDHTGNTSVEGVRLIVLGDWYSPPSRRRGQQVASNTQDDEIKNNNIAELLRYPLYSWDRTETETSKNSFASAALTAVAFPYGLGGHAHIPSLNQLLREATAEATTTVQFTNQIVDMLLQIPWWNSQAEMEEFYRRSPLNDSTSMHAPSASEEFPTHYVRSLGVLNAANTLALVHTSPNTTLHTETAKKEAKTKMVVCHLHSVVAENHQVLYKSVIAPMSSGKEGAKVEEKEDVVIQDAWSPIQKGEQKEASGLFGFLSFPKRPFHNHSHLNRVIQDGKIAIFTDTSCFSNFNNHFQAHAHSILVEEATEGSKSSRNNYDLSSYFCFEVLRLLLLATDDDDGNNNNLRHLQLVQQYAALQCKQASKAVTTTERTTAATLEEENEYEALYRLLEDGTWPLSQSRGLQEEHIGWVSEQLYHVGHYDEQEYIHLSGTVTTAAERALPELLFSSTKRTERLSGHVRTGNGLSFTRPYKMYAVMVGVNVLLLCLVLLYYYAWHLPRSYKKQQHRKKVL